MAKAGRRLRAKVKSAVVNKFIKKSKYLDIMSQQAYVVPYVYRNTIINGKNATFAGKTIITKVVIQSPFTISPGSTFSIQQNINSANHYYQNSLVQIATQGLIWLCEDFTSIGTLPNGQPSFPPNGQIELGSTPAGDIPGTTDLTPQIPASVKLQNGGYTIIFTTTDNGKDTITHQVTIIATVPNVAVYKSNPFIVSYPPNQGATNSGVWYDPLVTVSLTIGGLSGSQITVTGGSFLVSFDADVSDLVAGGTFWTEGIPYTNPPTGVPGNNCQSAETCNLVFPVINKNLSANGALLINNYNGSVYVTESGILNWQFSGLTNDEGGVATFGLVPHGQSPANGFYPLQIMVTNSSGTVSGSIMLSPGQKIGWNGDVVADGIVMDAYAYNNAAGNLSGYSQPVVINISDAIEFLGS